MTKTPAKAPAKNSDAAYGAESRSNILMFDPDRLTIVTDPKHALYEDLDGLEPSDEFVASIGFHGVLQPIIVHKDPETGKTIIVAGRKRVLAARLVNKERKKRGEMPLLVPAVTKRGEDVSLMAVMASENEARQSKSPMQRAKLMQRMMERGAVESDLATHFACSTVTVRNLLSLLDAPAAVRNAVERGEIEPSLGYKLAKLPPEEARAKLAEVKSLPAQHANGKPKKAKGGAKATAIVTGRVPVKTKSEIEALIASLQETHDDIAPRDRDVAVAALQWALGDDDRLTVFWEREGVFDEGEEAPPGVDGDEGEATGARSKVLETFDHSSPKGVE